MKTGVAQFGIIKTYTHTNTTLKKLGVSFYLYFYFIIIELCSPRLHLLVKKKKKKVMKFYFKLFSILLHFKLTIHVMAKLIF